MIEGSLDLGIMYTPQSRPGLAIEMLFEEELVLVSSERSPTKRPGKGYIYVDWGPEFQADHSLNYPDLSTPGVYMELGSLGLKYLLTNEGSGYFPKRLVEPYLVSKQLRLVKSAPTFSYPAYAVHPLDGEQVVLEPALDELRNLVQSFSGI